MLLAILVYILSIVYLSNKVQKLLNQTRKKIVKEKLEQDKNDQKKFWRSINALTGFGKSKNRKGLTEIVTDEGISLKGPEAANYMNEYYTNAGPTLAREFANSWEPADCNIENDRITSFEFITEQVVSKLVKGSLSRRILKDVFEIRICELTDIFNTCLDSSMFPSSWDIGEITPIPKVNIHSKNKTGEWRPITQIKLPRKLLERCVHFQLYNYFDENYMSSDLKRVLLLRYLTS